MGLIKAGIGAVGSTLHDQWKEAIRCDDLGNDILMKKVTTKNGVISNDSTIIVAPGQCAIIYDNGRIIDATAEEGVYVFDSSSTPSLFAGEFGKTFKEMWERFTYSGATAKEQAVYFFNIKEITDNKFGTMTPVPYKDWGHPIMNARTNSYIGMSVKIKCYGKYTFKICDPFLFMSVIAGISNEYRKDTLTEQIRTEVVSSFINVLNKLCTDEYKVEALEIPSKTLEIRKLMEKNDFDKSIKERGIKLVTFNVEGVSLDDESNEKIDKYEIGGDAYQQQGNLVGAYAEAMPEAAKNPNGAMNGFMGIGMMNMASSQMAGPMQASAFTGVKPMQPTDIKKEVENKDKWVCPNCKKEVDGKFCSNCGSKRPAEKYCSNCGKKLSVTNKFCPECGTKVEE